MKKLIIILIIIFNINITYAENLVIGTSFVIVSKELKKGYELLKKSFENMSYDIILEKFPNKRSINMANAGQTDGEFARIKGMEKFYPNLILVPEAVISLELYIYSTKEYKFKNIEEFLKSDLKLVHIVGIKLSGNLRNKLGKERFEESTNLETALMKINSERGDILIATPYQVDIILNKNKRLNKIIRSKNPIMTLSFYPYLNKKHKSIVDKLAKEIKKEKLKSLEEK